MSFNVSNYALTKRYSRSILLPVRVDGSQKRIRFGYRYYQKIFRRYRSRGYRLRINIKRPRLALKRRTLFSKALELKQRLIYFISGLTARKLQRYVQMSRSRSSSPSLRLARSIESRLDVLLYRSNLVSSPLVSKRLVKFGFVFVGSRCSKAGSKRIPLHTVVGLRIPSFIYSYLHKQFAWRVRNRSTFQPVPPWCEVNYATHTVIIFRHPKVGEVFYPFNFNFSYFYRLYPR